MFFFLIRSPHLKGSGVTTSLKIEGAKIQFFFNCYLVSSNGWTWLLEWNKTMNKLFLIDSFLNMFSFSANFSYNLLVKLTKNLVFFIFPVFNFQENDANALVLYEYNSEKFLNKIPSFNLINENLNLNELCANEFSSKTRILEIENFGFLLFTFKLFQRKTCKLPNFIVYSLCPFTSTVQFSLKISTP